jgi:KUP system potassium uptake protein
LADGIITPPMTITAAIEGLRELTVLRNLDQQTIVYTVLAIIAAFFFLQQFGTHSIGKMFGPIMLVWFSMLAILGSIHLFDDLDIFKALSPHYAIQFVFNYPGGFWLLGAVFLCTTGAEALYSDLGHCGSWQYPQILDFCKNLSPAQLFWTGCLYVIASEGRATHCPF